MEVRRRLKKRGCSKVNYLKDKIKRAQKNAAQFLIEQHVGGTSFGAALTAAWPKATKTR